MNSDIRLSVTFPTHPKTIMLIEHLGLEAVWALVRLWVFASQHRPDGVLRGMSLEAIRIACGYAGRIDALITALKNPETRFLDDDDPATGALVLHDWKTHNPWAAGAEERSERARKLAKLRWDAGRIAGRNAKGKASRIHSADAPSPSPSPSPSSQKTSADALRLSGLLVEMILKNNSEHRELSSGKREKCLHRWADDIDKLIRVDRKLPDEIERVIRFAQSDTFWIPNIMSGKKLREKYETLKMQVIKSGGGCGKGIEGNIGKVSTVGIKPTPGKYDGIETKVQAVKGGSLNG